MNRHGGRIIAHGAATVFRKGDLRIIHLTFSGFASELGDQFIGHGQARSADGMAAGDQSLRWD